MKRFIVGFRVIVILSLLVVDEVVFGQAASSKGRTASPRQAEPAKKETSKTIVIEFELLQAPDGGGYHSQQWIKVLAPLDVQLRVRRPLLNDKPELKERDVGNLRYITAIGSLDRSGKITFPGKAFDLSDSVKLKEWIDELRTFGVRGSPVGQPLWGMTKDQFGALFDSLTTPINVEVNNLPLSQLIAKLPFPKGLPLHWTADASDLLSQRGERTKLREELKGFSTATVLAIALNENGLGFRPNRTPMGDIELLIEPRNSKQEQWPIGWPIQQKISKAAPKLHVMVPIELNDVELSDVLEAISTMSEIPVLIDYAELEARKIDLSKIKVSFPQKITTWGIAISRLVVPHKLTRELWQDEAGRVFVWITTTHAGRAKDSDKLEQ